MQQGNTDLADVCWGQSDVIYIGFMSRTTNCSRGVRLFNDILLVDKFSIYTVGAERSRSAAIVKMPRIHIILA